MASKPSPKTSAPRAPRGSLRPTDVPGVFKNRAGLTVDENGVALSFKSIKQHDDARFTEVLGKTADTPLDILEGVARDPRQPMSVRIDAANKAAPYRHAKRVALTGADGVGPVTIGLDTMTRSRLDEYEELVRKALALSESK